MSLLDDLKNNSQNNGIIRYLDALKPLIDTVDLIATEPSGDLTIATHATTDHTGIMGVGDLTTATHATTDHTGIMGVGEDNPAQVSPAERTAGSEVALRSFSPFDVATMAGSSIAVIGPGAGEPDWGATIMAAWAAGASVVMLRAGGYNINTLINIPQGKSLLGSGGGAKYDATHPGAQLEFQAGSPRIIMSAHTRLAYLGIRLQTSMGTIVEADPSGAVIEHIGIKYNGHDGGRGIRMSGGGPYTVRCVIIDGNGQTQVQSLFFMSPIGNDHRSVIEHCQASNGNSHGFDVVGATSLFHCLSQGNAGQGFRMVSPDQNQVIAFCHAQQSGSDGFFVSGAGSLSSTVTLEACYARVNTGFGYNLPGGSTAGEGVFSNCRHSGNAGGTRTSGGGWSIQGEFAI